MSEAASASTSETDPLWPIGICMSGGGYRAAAFHLGALSYLDHLGLVDQVKIISTVSGGTFVGTRFAISQVDGESFEDFFKSFYSFLLETDLIQTGLLRLSEGKTRVPSGRQDVIVAMAEVYSSTFLAGKNGVPRCFGEVLTALADDKIALKEVIFNSTEFRNGLDFRFQSAGRIGNGKVSIPRDLAGQIRLGDITAMSSCFPGGFEPVGFPFDLVWPGDRVPPTIGAEYFDAEGRPRPLGIMDGGIYDNQGLEALMLSQERREAVHLETIIVSDVDQPNPDLYVYPQGTPPHGATLGLVWWVGRLIMFLCLLTFGVNAWHFLSAALDGNWKLLPAIAGLVSLTLSGVAGFGLFWLRRKFLDELKKIPEIEHGVWHDLKRLKVEQVVEMIELRVSSLMTLASSVFMKRIRGLIYSKFFTDPEIRPKLVSNLIYKLTSERERKALAKLPGVTVPALGSPLEKVAQAAVAMPTTLWFEAQEPWVQPSLVAAGQASLAYALLENLERRSGGVPRSGPAVLLWDRLLADTSSFQADPYFLLRKIRPGDYPSPP